MAQQFKATIEDFDAEDIRAFYDSSVFRVWHLGGKERTFKIAKVQRITKEFRGETSKRALLTLLDSKGREVPLPLELNATNRTTIQGIYGNRPKDWTGKLITLYPTTAEMAGKTVDAIRVRPYAPKATSKTNRQGVNVITPKATVDEDGVVHDGDPYTDRQPGDDSDEPPPGVLSSDNVIQ